MTATSASSTQSAWLSLITLVTIIYRSAGEPSQLIVCSQPDSFTVQITENENVVVYSTELLIRYNPHVGIFSFPGVEPVNIVFNESIIEFRGYMSPEYPLTRPSLSPETLSWTSSGIILGIGTLQKLSSEDYTVEECRLFLPRSIKYSANLSPAVKKEITYYARACIRNQLCQALGMIKTEEIQNINRYGGFGSNGFIPHIINPDNYQQNSTSDLNINVLADIGLKNGINYIKRSGMSIIKIPDVNEVRTVGPFGMKCYLNAANGTFEDFSTLKRTEDALLSNTGQALVVKVGLGLSTAKFSYSYKLKYGMMTVTGRIIGAVKELALAAKVAIRYSKTCIVNVEYINVTRFGKVNITMTGLGPLNSLTSKLLIWLTDTWRNNIGSFVKINLMRIAKIQLNKYICQDIIYNTSLNISLEDIS